MELAKARIEKASCAYEIRNLIGCFCRASGCLATSTVIVYTELNNLLYSIPLCEKHATELMNSTPPVEEITDVEKVS